LQFYALSERVAFVVEVESAGHPEKRREVPKRAGMFHAHRFGTCNDNKYDI